MRAFAPRLRHQVRLLGPWVLLVNSLVAPALASGPGPNGVNVGFDFNWNNGPAGLNACFIAAVSPTGATLNCDGGPLTPATSTGAFAFSYSVAGVPQQSNPPGGVYSTWTGICDANPSNSAPLTTFSCFNNNSFGETFVSTATGALTGITMKMTCLNPAGSPLTGLHALFYQVNPNGISIPATPISQIPVDLSACPTLQAWTGHTFSASDFVDVHLNFPGITLVSGGMYGVFFGGLVPGAQPPGFATAPTIAKAFGSTSIPVNGTTTLSFTLSNPNTTIALSSVAFTDTFPAGLVVAPTPGATSSCGGTFTAAAGAGSVNLAGGSMAAGGSCSISVTVQGTKLGALANTAGPVTTAEALPGAASNTAPLLVGTSEVPALSPIALAALAMLLLGLGVAALVHRGVA